MVSGRDRDPAFRKKTTGTKKPASTAPKPVAKPAPTPSPKTEPTVQNTMDDSSKSAAGVAGTSATMASKPSTVEKPIPKNEPVIPSNQNPHDGRTSTRSKIMGVIVALLFLIGLIALGYMVIQSIMEKEAIEKLDNSFSNDGVKALGPNSTDAITGDENDNSTSSEGTPHDGAIGEELQSEESSISETELSTDNNMESEMNEAKATHSEKSETAQEKEAIKTKIIRKKGEFELPSWIIAFSANSKKPLANTNYSTLEALGYDAGIYWIPKYFPGGSEMYKVYVGPYKTAEEAQRMLPAIRNLQPDAYVLKIEE